MALQHSKIMFYFVPRLELLESRFALDGDLAYQFLASNLTDPTGSADGIDHISWYGPVSKPGDPATVGVYLHSHSGASRLTVDQKARIQDAMAELNQTWTGTDGLRLVEVFKDSQAQIHVHNSNSSPCGSKAQGVLGCAAYYYYTASTPGPDDHDFYRFVGRELGRAYQPTVTLITGWNWYSGVNSSGIGSNQFDYQTVVTQELAHAVGLDHDENMYSNLGVDGHSAMYPYGIPGHPHRLLSDHDLDSLRHLYAHGLDPGSGGTTGGSLLADSSDHDHGDGLALGTTAFSLMGLLGESNPGTMLGFGKLTTVNDEENLGSEENHYLFETAGIVEPALEVADQAAWSKALDVMFASPLFANPYLVLEGSSFWDPGKVEV